MGADSAVFAGCSMNRRILAGFPATMALEGTSFVTTLPAPTIAFSPTETLARIVAPDPMDAPFLTTVAFNFPIGLGLQGSFSGGGARIDVVDESNSVTDEDVILNHDAFADEGVAGDLAALPTRAFF